MRATTSTGGVRDFILLIAESTDECAELVSIHCCPFLEKSNTDILTDESRGGKKTIGLRIYIGAARENSLSPVERAEIDATP